VAADESQEAISGTRRRSDSVSDINYARQPIWILGLACVFIGSLADFAAFAMAPQATIAPLGSLTLVANVIFAPLLLGEKVGQREIIATILIVCGAALAVAYSPQDDKSETSTQVV